MAEAPTWPATRVGNELRHIAAARRLKQRRLTLLALIVVAATPVALTAVWRMPTVLIWNASASAPIGLYKVEGHAPLRRGDMVIAWLPAPARSLAAARHYLPANVPLVKRIAAAQGDRVCAAGASIQINGRRAATRRPRDFLARPMPFWSGCRTLNRGEFFLLMDSPQSFDGRYFGITRQRDLIGRAVLLWPTPKHSGGG